MESITLKIKELSSLIESSPKDCDLLMERAVIYYKMSQLHAAYNDIALVLTIEPNHPKAAHYSKLIEMVMNFEYRENYNV